MFFVVVAVFVAYGSVSRCSLIFWWCLAYVVVVSRSQSLRVCELCACVSIHLVHIARQRFIQTNFFPGARAYFMVSLTIAFIVLFLYKLCVRL